MLYQLLLICSPQQVDANVVNTVTEVAHRLNFIFGVCCCHGNAAEPDQIKHLYILYFLWSFDQIQCKISYTVWLSAGTEGHVVAVLHQCVIYMKHKCTHARTHLRERSVQIIVHSCSRLHLINIKEKMGTLDRKEKERCWLQSGWKGKIKGQVKEEENGYGNDKRVKKQENGISVRWIFFFFSLALFLRRAFFHWMKYGLRGDCGAWIKKWKE